MISILCPTRKRPQNLYRMIESAVNTSNRDFGLDFCLYVDDDDTETQRFLANPQWLPQRKNGLDSVAVLKGARITMSDMWNALIPIARGDLLMMMGDDVVFRTKDWDAMVDLAFATCPDKILLVHGDDRGPSGTFFATLPIIHRRWYEVLGYFAGPGFSGDFADTWPNDVAQMIGRKKYVPFIVEHMHWLWKKAPHDQTYIEKEQRMTRDQCGLAYERRIDERRRDAEKLRAAMLTELIQRV